MARHNSFEEFQVSEPLQTPEKLAVCTELTATGIGIAFLGERIPAVGRLVQWGGLALAGVAMVYSFSYFDDLGKESQDRN